MAKQLATRGASGRMVIARTDRSIISYCYKLFDNSKEFIISKR